MAAIQGFLQTLVIAILLLAAATNLGLAPHLGQSASTPALPPAVHMGATHALI